MNELDINGIDKLQTATQSLMQDLRHIIEQARNRVAYATNSELAMMYWHIGERINRDVLENERAEYGKQIVATVSTQLPPLGLLRCTEGSEEQIELLQLDKAGIKVAKYITELPPREVLQRQIQKSMEIAKARFENYFEEDE